MTEVDLNICRASLLFFCHFLSPLNDVDDENDEDDDVCIIGCGSGGTISQGQSSQCQPTTFAEVLTQFETHHNSTTIPNHNIRSSLSQFDRKAGCKGSDRIKSRSKTIACLNLNTKLFAIWLPLSVPFLISS